MSNLDIHHVDPMPLARRLELAIGAAMAECAQNWAARDVMSDYVAAQIAGAWIIAGEGESPLARVVGLGMDQTPTDEELATIESLFEERGQPPRIELACHADQGLWQRLADRGYRAVGATAVFVRSLDGPIDHQTPESAVRIEIDRLDAADDEAVAEAVTVMSRAFQDPPPAWITRTTHQAAVQPSARVFLARLNGNMVGGAFLVVDDDVAMLFGGGVLDGKRRCGVHSALIRGRLLWGRDSGAHIAFMQGRPGSTTERNARRAGFSLAYTKMSLVKEPA